MNAPRTIRPYRRWLIGVLALLLLLAEVAGFLMSKSIHEYYLKDYGASYFGASDATVALLVVYLVRVAFTGRWSAVARRTYSR
jgi:hypothetical protein